MPRPLRLMVYDRTCTGDLLAGLRHRPGDSGFGRLLRRVGERAQTGPGLSHSWMIGGGLYSLLGRVDDWLGFADWPSALRWLADYPGDRPIAEVQFWGHGKWGCARVGDERLERSSLAAAHPHHGPLRAIAQRMAGGEQPALWWFRTCETFGADPGQRFALDFVDFMGCRAAGHTYVIGPWQSGLHSLGPGERPRWSADEGLAEGSSQRPLRAHWSRRGEPNTISCLHGRIPAGY